MLLRLGPERGYGCGDDAVAEGEDVRAGVQDDAGGECVGGLVAEPGQVARVRGGDGSGGFDLDPDQLSARGLYKQVYFPAPLFFAHVV